jgi:hypothetical protein
MPSAAAFAVLLSLSFADGIIAEFAYVSSVAIAAGKSHLRCIQRAPCWRLVILFCVARNVAKSSFDSLMFWLLVFEDSLVCFSSKIH